MDCRRAKTRLIALSTDSLPEKVRDELHQHFKACPDCHKEWLVVEDTLTTLSTTSQPIVTKEQTQRMWLTCSERLHQKIEAERIRGKRSSAGLFNPARRPFAFGGHSTRSMAWSWAALGGALAILGGVYFLTPQAALPSDNAPSVPTLSASTAGDPGAFIALGRSSDSATTLVDHHTSMVFSPFSDRVGSTLVSYSATPRDDKR